MNNRWYKFFKYILIGPWLRVWNRPFYIGGDKVPQEGAALMVSNHLAVMDHFYWPLVARRQLTFLAKSEYFTTPGFVGRIQRFFVTSVGQVPIDRTSGDAARDALEAGLKVLSRGDLLGIAVEGTRSPDARLYKGKTGAARMALESGVPVYPVALVNTEKANPLYTWIPRPVRVGVIIGDPIDPTSYAEKFDDERVAARALTEDIVLAIQKISGQDYVDAYAADVKKSIADGKGYPEGTEPGGTLIRPAFGPKPNGKRR